MIYRFSTNRFLSIARGCIMTFATTSIASTRFLWFWLCWWLPTTCFFLWMIVIVIEGYLILFIFYCIGKDFKEIKYLFECTLALTMRRDEWWSAFAFAIHECYLNLFPFITVLHKVLFATTNKALILSSIDHSIDHFDILFRKFDLRESSSPDIMNTIHIHILQCILILIIVIAIRYNFFDFNGLVKACKLRSFSGDMCLNANLWSFTLPNIVSTIFQLKDIDIDHLNSYYRVVIYLFIFTQVIFLFDRSNRYNLHIICGLKEISCWEIPNLKVLLTI